MAEPLIDTPRTIVRRLAGLPPLSDVELYAPATDRGSRGSRTAKRVRKSKPRAPLGTLLPEQEYELPILRYLSSNGGQAPSSEVVKAVGRELSDRLTEADRETLSTGGVRWENRVHFTRLRLVERGLIRRDSQRGVWALTDAGMSAARNGAVPSA